MLLEAPPARSQPLPFTWPVGTLSQPSNRLVLSASVLQRSGLRQCTWACFLGDWLLAFIAFGSSIHGDACSGVHSFSLSSSIPPVRTSHDVFAHATRGGCLGCFWLSAVRAPSAANILGEHLWPFCCVDLLAYEGGVAREAVLTLLFRRQPACFLQHGGYRAQTDKQLTFKDLK